MEETGGSMKEFVLDKFGIATSDPIAHRKATKQVYRAIGMHKMNSSSDAPGKIWRGSSPERRRT